MDASAHLGLLVDLRCLLTWLTAAIHKIYSWVCSIPGNDTNRREVSGYFNFDRQFSSTGVEVRSRTRRPQAPDTGIQPRRILLSTEPPEQTEPHHRPTSRRFEGLRQAQLVLGVCRTPQTQTRPHDISADFNSLSSMDFVFGEGNRPRTRKKEARLATMRDSYQTLAKLWHVVLCCGCELDSSADRKRYDNFTKQHNGLSIINPTTNSIRKPGSKVLDITGLPLPIASKIRTKLSLARV
ncbi:hypothetical protein MKZ38_003978 [Zalerion maritima]|uniref:Uncharacterized protein n=1 Tax=Zalerion maritima TaxID=339359 RepID=A0AAD5WRE3_9PEZI|nr:hypothetical protein MKZ38_003978 [Zalerion maritima]